MNKAMDKETADGAVVDKSEWPTLSMPGAHTARATSELIQCGENCLDKPDGNVITPDAPLRDTFEVSKTNKHVSFSKCQHSCRVLERVATWRLR